MNKNNSQQNALTKMEGIDNISKQLAEKERVDRLEKWAHEVGEKVGVLLKI